MRAKASVRVANDIRRDIVKGTLRAGDPLPSEGVLAEHFGVSDTTIRSAFRILESESLLSVARGPSGGARVTFPNVDVAVRAVGILLHLQGTQLREFFDARRIIEPAAAFSLTERQPSDGVAVLESLVEEEQRAIASSEFDAYRATSVAFYRAVTDHCGNRVFTVFGAVLQILLLNTISLAVATTNELDVAENAIASAAAHRELVRLVKA